MIEKRYFIVKNITNANDATVFATGTALEVGTANVDNYDLLKMDYDAATIPAGELVTEYASKDEATIAKSSVVFTDYSGLSDSQFVSDYEKFTTNDKNLGRIIRQSINAWSAKNTSAWPISYHSAVWTNYDELNQRLSDGALVPAYLVFLNISNTINDPVTTDNVDVSNLNALLLSEFTSAFEKFPR